MNKKQEIILRWREGYSKSEIARIVGRHRDTVRKYIGEYEKKRKELIETSDEVNIPEIIDDIVSKPKYNSGNRNKRKLTDEIIEEINRHLKENKLKKQRGEGKQQKKKIDIYEALIRDGYDIGYSTICNTISEIQGKGVEAYIKAVYDPGDVCEFDWGMVKLIIAGKPKKVQMAAFTSAFGNYRYAKLFMNQKTESFQEAHADFFEKTKGPFSKMVYDNMKVAVRRFVGIYEKEPTEGLLKLSIYYGFKFRFCNVRRGNEKGHVERSVEYIRRKAFCDCNSFDTLEEANTYLENMCDQLNNKNQTLKGKTANELFEEEKQYLGEYLPKFDAAITNELKVDKYSCLTIEQNHYSVPDQYVGKIIFVKIFTSQIICYYNNEKIAIHNRKYDLHEWSIKIDHYVNTLKRKPGALTNSIAMSQADQKLKTIYKKHYIRKEKDFIDLILLIQEKSLPDIEKAIKKLEDIDFTDISTDKIKLICDRQNYSNDNKATFASKQSREIKEHASAMLKNLSALLPVTEDNINKEVQII